MGDARTRERGGDPYERLLQRLALALDEAETASTLRAERRDELELKGLSSAEMELVQAYLNRDMNWLRGWHAAAEQLALQHQPRRGSKPVHGKAKPRLMIRRHLLYCALCGAGVSWQRHRGVMACQACGSQLFRSGKPR
ncbi:hypothetical protein ACSVIJ_02760 [Pseudomonas sp. NCHU5208]|uniref:hypothetical protein n=1 Tax=unclassified Pseudomonas TaxID=196821 RepID=UPI003F99F576